MNRFLCSKELNQLKIPELNRTCDSRVESVSCFNLLNQISSSVEQRFQVLNKTNMDHFISSVEKPFQVLLKSWDTIIFNFQWVAYENASLRVYVGMMNDKDFAQW